MPKFLIEEYLDRNRVCILMGCKVGEEKVETLIKLIVEKWVGDGVKRMSRLKSKYGMTMAVAVQEHVRDQLILLKVYNVKTTEYISKEKNCELLEKGICRAWHPGGFVPYNGLVLFLSSLSLQYSVKNLRFGRKELDLQMYLFRASRKNSIFAEGPGHSREAWLAPPREVPGVKIDIHYTRVIAAGVAIATAASITAVAAIAATTIFT
ncbi:hypothetical protein BGX38DRAFT_1331682 [Terfezia claveryi]|nr:hypothetical protein BGX38DRAFT_1331682 [Terfezia claveryi]